MGETIPKEKWGNLSWNEMRELAPNYWLSTSIFIGLLLFVFLLLFIAGSWLMAIFWAGWGAVAAWAGTDALQRRELSAHIWTWAVFLLGIIGLIAYLIVRSGNEKVTTDEWTGESKEADTIRGERPSKISDSSPSKNAIDRICPDCGQVLETNDRFCSACGKDVSAGVEAPDTPNV